MLYSHRHIYSCRPCDTLACAQWIRRISAPFQCPTCSANTRPFGFSFHPVPTLVSESSPGGRYNPPFRSCSLTSLHKRQLLYVVVYHLPSDEQFLFRYLSYVLCFLDLIVAPFSAYVKNLFLSSLSRVRGLFPVPFGQLYCTTLHCLVSTLFSTFFGLFFSPFRRSLHI